MSAGGSSDLSRTGWLEIGTEGRGSDIRGSTRENSTSHCGSNAARLVIAEIGVPSWEMVESVAQSLSPLDSCGSKCPIVAAELLVLDHVR